MQETKTNCTIQIKDLVNCVNPPYSNPTSESGSSNIKPNSNKTTNIASATVELQRSAYLKGQLLHVNIGIRYPKSFKRDPSCWIQLVRKDSYRAGE